MAESNYDILGVPSGASKTQIRIAFRELALKHHSDRGGHDEYFIKIKQAFEDLKTGKKVKVLLGNGRRRKKAKKHFIVK